MNNELSPGDELNLKDSDSVSVEVKWKDIKNATGRIEIIHNGKVAARLEGQAGPGQPLVLKTRILFRNSGWICARRMNNEGHQSHTAPVYIYVDNKPIRANADDVQFFIAWIDNILKNIQPGHPWNRYYSHDLDLVEARYNRAKEVYEKILRETIENQPGQ